MNDVVIPALDNLPALPWKEKLAVLLCQFLDLPQAECPVEHHFDDGLYIREMRIPADTLFIGRTHRHGHRCELVSGSVIYITEAGRRVLEAPYVVFTKPGDQMVVHTLSDVVGRTYHPNPTDTTDTDALELEAFEPVESLTSLGRSVLARLEATCQE
jgi:hypothetical protein